jgi:hypothetical protein
MTPDQLEAALRAWGRFYGERPPPEWGDEPEPQPLGAGVHPIARAMEFAGGRDKPVGRAASSMARVRGTPSWGFDPVACSETRTHRISTPDDVPPIVRLVEAAAMTLYRQDTLTGTILRWEYCKRGKQIEKAAMLVTVGLNAGVRVYREKLAYAKGWMQSRMTT